MPAFEGVDPDHSEQRVPIYSCTDCGLGVSRPLICPDQAQLYPEGYYGTEESANLLNKAALSIFCLERRFRSGVVSCGGSILDFGCGDGTFLSSIASGWRKFGFETSAEGRKISSSRGIQLIEFEDASISKFDHSFDRITLWQVLEHISDPGPVVAQPVNSPESSSRHGDQVEPASSDSATSCRLRRMPSVTGLNSGRSGRLRSNQVVNNSVRPGSTSTISAAASEPGSP